MFDKTNYSSDCDALQKARERRIWQIRRIVKAKINRAEEFVTLQLEDQRIGA